MTNILLQKSHPSVVLLVILALLVYLSVPLPTSAMAVTTDRTHGLRSAEETEQFIDA